MIIPGEKRKIEEEFDKAREVNGPLTKEQKHKIAARVHRRMKRTIARGAIFGALGLTAIVGGTKLLTSGSEEPVKEPTTQEISAEENTTEKDFKEGLKVDLTEQITEEQKEENDIFKEIVEEYNSEYPENTISEDDLGIVESKPQFVVQGRDSEGNNYYIQDYKMQVQNLNENEQVLYDNDNAKVDEIYVIVNKKDGTIIYSQGMIDAHVVTVDTKVVQDKEGIEYFSKNTINLGNSEAEKVIINDKLKDKYKKILEEKNEEKNTDKQEKQNDDSEMEL